MTERIPVIIIYRRKENKSKENGQIKQLSGIANLTVYTSWIVYIGVTTVQRSRVLWKQPVNHSTTTIDKESFYN